MKKDFVSEFTKWSGVVGLVISVIALVLSWQNTEATRQLVSSNITFLNSNFFRKEMSKSSFENIETLGCTYVLRLANSGGASASIVDGEVSVVYQDVTYTASLEGDPVTSIGYPTKPLDGLGFALLPSEMSSLPIDVSWTADFIQNQVIVDQQVPFPLQIAPFGTLDVKAQIILMFRTLSGQVDGKELLALAKNVPVEFRLRTASGQSILIQDETCG